MTVLVYVLSGMVDSHMVELLYHCNNNVIGTWH